MTEKDSYDGPADGRPVIDSHKQPSMFSLKMFKSNRISPTNKIDEQAGNSSVDKSLARRVLSLIREPRVSPTSSESSGSGD